MSMLEQLGIFEPPEAPWPWDRPPGCTCCPVHDGAAILAALMTISKKQGEIMSALTDLQAADTALKTEVAEFLADIAGRLGTVDDASAEAVVADINAEVAALQAADPNAAPPAVPSPAS
jgi:hypothetical protein